MTESYERNNYQPDARCQALYETTQQFLDRIPMEPETLPRYLQTQGRFPQLSVTTPFSWRCSIPQRPVTAPLRTGRRMG